MGDFSFPMPLTIFSGQSGPHSPVCDFLAQVLIVYGQCLFTVVQSFGLGKTSERSGI